MSEKSDRWKKWEATRALGENNYVWKFGVLWWGGMMALAFGLWHYYQPTNPQWVGYALLVLFPIGGYFVGRWTWRLMERQYLKERAQE